ncbi:FAD dependent oxidoreductase [Armillaria nabsnona]|nr:FAD dependent oxidoreductase [Armillaria nabsnona]
MLPTATLLLGLAGTALGFNTCRSIAGEVSSATDVYYPARKSQNVVWNLGLLKMSASSFLGILGYTKTPFGIKGGGHATNQGFSSTTGVQIAMTRFDEITYDSTTQTAVIGAGNIWDDVYEVLNAQGVNVLGGRLTGIGVAGLTLGGGYSYLSNQYGLAIDNVVAYELVVPNATVVTVTEENDPDLFFSLKGGSNNYGIVTRFTLKTHPQGAVWGGAASSLLGPVPFQDGKMYTKNVVTFRYLRPVFLIGKCIGPSSAYNASYTSAFNAAAVKFCSEVTDPKAAMVIVYGYTSGQVFLSTQMFYDDPTPPDGIFNDFLAIPASAQDITTRSFFDLINSTFASTNVAAGYRYIPALLTACAARTVYNHIPTLEYSESFIEGIVDELNFWGPTLSVYGELSVTYGVEPFLPSLLTHAPVGSSAYPSSRDHVVFPTIISFEWVSESEDDVFHDAARQTADRLGVASESIYPNYAIYDTPVVDMYGEEGVKRMEATRERVDPYGVMLLTGGFKV